MYELVHTSNEKEILLTDVKAKIQSERSSDSKSANKKSSLQYPERKDVHRQQVYKGQGRIGEFPSLAVVNTSQEMLKRNIAFCFTNIQCERALNKMIRLRISAETFEVTCPLPWCTNY